MMHPLEHLGKKVKFDWRIVDEWVVIGAWSFGIAAIVLFVVALFL